MKRIININLSGRVIPIEDSAYDTLKQYLDRLQRHFASEEGKDEILQDIENRIAELFNRQLEKGAGCITDLHVQDVTRQLGEPEEMDSEEPAPGPGTYQQQKTGNTGSSSGQSTYSNPDPGYYRSHHRKFFRDPDDQWVGGVCSGLAHYLHVDPMIIRLAVAILMFVGGAGFLAYLIVWAITPEAATTAEKLEMRGQSVNIENIKYYSEGKPGFAPSARRMAGFGEIISKLVRVAIKIISFIIIAIALAVLIGLLMSALGLFTGWVTMPPMKTLVFEEPWKSNVLFTSAILLAVIPLLAITINILRRVMGYRNGMRGFNTLMLALWIVALAATVYTGIELGQSFRFRKQMKENIALQLPANRSLHIMMNEMDEDDIRHGWSWRRSRTDDLFFNMDDSLMMADLEVHFIPSQDSTYQMDLIRSAKGISRSQASANAQKLVYSWSFADSTLQLSNAFTLASVTPWRDQYVKVFIKVPLNKIVTLAPEVEGYTSDEDYYGYEDKRELDGPRPVAFRMTTEGLKATTLPDDSTRKIYRERVEEPEAPAPVEIDNSDDNNETPQHQTYNDQHHMRQQLAIFPLHIYEMVM